MSKNKRKNQPKIYSPRPYPRNFGYTIIQTLSLAEGIDILGALPRKGGRNRVSNLVELAKVNTTCVCCGAVGSKFCLGEGKNVGINNRGADRHWDLYTEDDLALSIDHITPKSKGGINHLDNYQLLCIVCNVFKGNKPERLIPYKRLLEAKIGVVPMIIANNPYLSIKGGKRLETGLYEELKEYLNEELVDGEYRYFLIDHKVEQIEVI